MKMVSDCRPTGEGGGLKKRKQVSNLNINLVFISKQSIDYLNFSLRSPRTANEPDKIRTPVNSFFPLFVGRLRVNRRTIILCPTRIGKQTRTFFSTRSKHSTLGKSSLDKLWNYKIQFATTPQCTFNNVR